MEVSENSKFANNVLIIRPTNFKTNYETFEDNKFMKEISESNIQQKALDQFSNFSEKLIKNFNVMIYDQCDIEAVDSVFPNNWFSTHRNKNIPEGLLIIYPMKSQLRRKERNPLIINDLKNNYKHFKDLSYLENENEFLEGTGSLIFDEKNKNIFCSISERATEKALKVFMDVINEYSSLPYKLITFKSYDLSNNLIYHTNVMMSILKNDIIICLESIKNEEEKNIILSEIQKYNIIDVTYDEMNHFICNILCLNGKNENYFIAVSKTACDHMSDKTMKSLKKNYEFLIAEIETIEQVGGGSARCMIAELF